MANVFVVAKAILTRIIFATHGFIAIWRATSIKSDPYYWYLCASILALCFEGIFTLTIKKNQEWKWFCPSVFLYLASVVPAIWLIEVDKFDKRMANLTLVAAAAAGKNGTLLRLLLTTTTTLPPPPPTIYTSKGSVLVPGGGAFPPAPPIAALPPHGGAGGAMTPISIQGVNLEIPVDLDEEMWATVIEQLLMLILIIGRWMLPKGGLTRDQLSQLLLVYIGTAADIIEFFDSFKDEKIAQNRVLCLMILSIWSWSLLQFTLVLTATKSRRTRLTGVESQEITPKAKLKNGIIKVKEVCCSVDVWAILINIILQDAPFLIFRMLLITYYRIISYMNIFFTCKNTLVIILQFYRLFVVQMEKKKEINRALKANVSGNLMKAIGQAAFLGRRAELESKHRAAVAAAAAAAATGGGARGGVKKSRKLRGSQESISSRNTRFSDAPSRTERSKRRKSLSTGNLRTVAQVEADQFVEEELDDLEIGVSASVIGSNPPDSPDDSGDDDEVIVVPPVVRDDVSVLSERAPKRGPRANVRMSENPGIYRISGSRSSASASSDRDRGDRDERRYRQDTGYSSSSKDSGQSGRRDRRNQSSRSSARSGGHRGSQR